MCTQPAQAVHHESLSFFESMAIHAAIADTPSGGAGDRSSSK